MGLATPPEGLVAARELPDGRMELTETGGDVGATIAALRAYDPECALVRNVVDGLWEIHRRCEDGELRRVGSWKADRVPHPDRVVQQLAAHDIRRGYRPLEAIDRHNELVDRNRDRQMDEQFEDIADKFHWAVKKDLGGLA